MEGQYYNLWSTDNDRTDANDEVVIKSVYDPSPVGYSLPAANAFTGFTTTGGHTNNPAEYNVKGKFDKGWHFYTKPSKQGIPFFFPASGFRFCNTGTLDHVTMYGYYWVAGPLDTNYGRHLDFDSGYVYPLVGTNRSYGFPVCSAEERETHKFNINTYMDGKYYNLWSTDNERTEANDDVVIKTVYDPSPVGYSLPASNAFTGFTTGGNTWNSAEYNVKGGFDKGWYFYTKPNKKGDTFFFPINGCHYYNSGIISQVSINGLCLVAHPASDISDRHLNFTSEYIIPLGGNHRSWALAVRSAEEKVRRKILRRINFLSSQWGQHKCHRSVCMRNHPRRSVSYGKQGHSFDLCLLYWKVL